jgi:FAD/FMN-containing dehydrogenase
LPTYPRPASGGSVTIMTMTETSVPAAAVDDLRANLRGQALTPHDAGYDEARKVWNGSIDRYPGLVVRCAGVSDVRAAVRLAVEHGLPVAIRGGAHNVAGSGTCDGGLVLDLSPMRSVRVDPWARTASADPGLLWRDLDRETQEFGLAVTGGIVSTTGIAGFTLGGGIGYLHRSFGFTVDNLLGADVVTAGGDFVRADADTNPELFWALRGGGGNFGVVTRFDYGLHQVGPMVQAGLIMFPAADLRAVVAGFRDVMLAGPDELGLFVVLRRAPAAPWVPEAVRGEPVVVVLGCYAGSPEAGERAMAPLRDFAEPVADLLTVRPYTQFQSMLDGSWAPGFGNYWKAEYLTGIPDAALDVLAEYLDRITSPLSDFKFPMLGGSIARVPPDATAYAHRGAPFALNINSRWADPAETQRHAEWTRGLWEDMRPFSFGGVYVNFMGDEGEDRVRHAYGPGTYERLVAVKDRYDPQNVLRLNHNIRPSGGAE